MRKLVLALLVGSAFTIAVPLAWFVVDQRVSADRVVSNVTLDGVAIGSSTSSELRTVVGERARVIENSTVTVEFDGASITASAREMGVSVDEDATVAAAMAAGRSGNGWSDFSSWITGRWSPRDVSSVWVLDTEAARIHLTAHPGTTLSEPVEPSFELTDEGYRSIPGTPGAGLDIDAAVLAIQAAYRPGEDLVVNAPIMIIPTKHSDQEADSLVDRLDALTDGGVTVRLLGGIGRLSERSLRQHLIVTGPLSDPEISFDSRGLNDELLHLFASVSRAGSDPVFDVVDGVPVVVEPGSAPQGCCGEESGDILVEALEAGVDGPVDIPATAVDEPQLTGWAEGAGVEDLVATFTTEHACCEARVSNIHRIADLVRGQYLLPGESFSVNEFVGERTIDKGFVAAGVIERGRFTESVGGGISQFATTLFNSAFFAGLDLDEYQSHSIYISRYPYGREATLSYPKPDLRITNSTEYPVLVWPTYTETSITVELYSTDHILVEETGQEARPFNRCTDVETFRSRTYPDGTVVEDSVVARYRPGEGLDCNGNPTPQP